MRAYGGGVFDEGCSLASARRFAKRNTRKRYRDMGNLPAKVHGLCQCEGVKSARFTVISIRIFARCNATKGYSQHALAGGKSRGSMSRTHVHRSKPCRPNRSL